MDPTHRNDRDEACESYARERKSELMPPIRYGYNIRVYVGTSRVWN
jgi:hypothetical protein